MNGFRGGSRIHTMPISDRMNGKSDNFIVDLESFSNGGLEKDVTANSRINMQRSFSRKGGEQELVSSASSSSPRAAQTGCNSTPEKMITAAYSQPPVMVGVGPADPCDNQPAVKSGSFNAATMALAPKSRWGRRYSSFKRSPPPYWFSDPKRVLLFFATLSSLGTILLIYFTLSASNSYANDADPEWQQ